MRVYIIEEYRLLKHDGVCLITEDGIDTVLLDTDAKLLAEVFFAIIPALEWFNICFGPVRDHYVLDRELSKFMIDDTIVINDVARAEMIGNLVYKGYIFLKWEFYEDYAIDGPFYLYMAVFSMTGRFVGSRSTRNSTSTTELSRLIMQMPEIAWEV